jgi:hypothetical protein
MAFLYSPSQQDLDDSAEEGSDKEVGEEEDYGYEVTDFFVVDDIRHRVVAFGLIPI